METFRNIVVRKHLRWFAVIPAIFACLWTLNVNAQSRAASRGTFSGYNAGGALLSQGDIYSVQVSIDVNSGSWHSTPGGVTTGTNGNVSVGVTLNETGETIYAGESFSFSDLLLHMEPDLSSARFEATIPLYFSDWFGGGPASKSIDLNLAWVATGPSTRSMYNDHSISSAGIYRYRGSGTYREAVLSGSATFDGAPYALQCDCWWPWTIGETKSGYWSVIKKGKVK